MSGLGFGIFFGDLTNPFHFLKISHLYYYYAHEKGDKNAKA